MTNAREFLISATLLDIADSLENVSSIYTKCSIILFTFVTMKLGSNHSAYISISCLATEIGVFYEFIVTNAREMMLCVTLVFQRCHPVFLQQRLGVGKAISLTSSDRFSSYPYSNSCGPGLREFPWDFDLASTRSLVNATKM